MTIRALHVPVDTEQPLRIVEIPESESLEQLQALVEGSFQCIDLQLDITCWLNEEGKITGLQYNHRAQRLYVETYGLADIIVGPAVLTGGVDDQGSTLGVSDAQLEHVDQLLGPFARVRIENTYSDGHESTTEVWLHHPQATPRRSLRTGGRTRSSSTPETATALTAPLARSSPPPYSPARPTWWDKPSSGATEPLTPPRNAP